MPIGLLHPRLPCSAGQSCVYDRNQGRQSAAGRQCAAQAAGGCRVVSEGEPGIGTGVGVYCCGREPVLLPNP